MLNHKHVMYGDEVKGVQKWRAQRKLSAGN